MKEKAPYLIVFVLVGALLFAFARTAPIWYDDAGHFLVAEQIARGNGMCYPVSDDRCEPNSPFITMGPVLAYPLGWWMDFTYMRMPYARLLMVLLGLGTAFALFRLGRQLTTATKALIAVGLLALNIQFLTYGAETLGEVPMMGLFLGGLVALVQWERGGKWWLAALGLLSWCAAVGIKEYAALPTGLGLGIWFVTRLIAGDRPVRALVLVGVYACMLVGTLMLLHGPDLMGYFWSRQSYASEFLTFGWELSLKYLLFKPLFWLGTAAMCLRWLVKRRREEALVVPLQLAWIFFFLLSAGYDRFGFLLLFLPAIYLAEFVPYLWQEAGRRPEWAWAKRLVLVVILFAICSQQTFLTLGKRMAAAHPANWVEMQAAFMCEDFPETTVVTAEQQISLFLPGTKHSCRLISIVPSQGRHCYVPHPDFELGEDEIFLAGPYAFTEYHGCIDWQSWEAIDSVVAEEGKWVYFRNKKVVE